MFEQCLVRVTSLATAGAGIKKSVLEVFALDMVPNIGPGLVAKISTQTALIKTSGLVSNNVLKEC